jgi:hypothetical protein
VTKDNVFFFSFLAVSVRDNNNDRYKYVIIYLYYYLYYFPLLPPSVQKMHVLIVTIVTGGETFKIYNLTFRIYKLLGDGGKKRLQCC